MKKVILSILVASISIGSWAQQLRTNYRSGGFTHTSTEYESIVLADIPAQARVELVGLPDGSSLYLLYLNLLQDASVVAPKGVKLSATLSNGKFVRLDQIGQDSATKKAMEDGKYLNRLKYAAEPADMEMMCSGVNSLDIVTGWNPEDYIQASFKADEFAKLLKSHCETIAKAYSGAVELSATVAGYTDNANSIMTTSNPVVARGENFDYNVILSHLYYKNNCTEDIDLAFVIGSSDKYHVTYDAKVKFTLRDGSEITLLQTRDEINFVYLYPSMEQLQQMAATGISSVSIDCESGTIEDSIPASPEDFSNAINQQLQLLLSMSPR